jgi:SAM-dependent methyltransferase
LTSNLVEKGYDRVAAVYNTNRHSGTCRDGLEDFASRLSENANVLDAGCGTGYASRFLDQRGFSVTGIDISNRMLDFARKKVPGATFLKMDMKDMDLRGDLFDGIVSLYAIIHVDRKFHREILSKFYEGLKPSGFLLLLTGWGDYVGTEDDYLVKGTRMSWSYFDRDVNLRMIKQSGFRIIWTKRDKKGKGVHLLVLARKM